MANDPISGVSQAGRREPPASLPQGRPAEALASPAPAVLAATPVQGLREPPSPPDAEAVKRAAERINEFIRSTSRSLEFSVDKDTGIVVVKVVDQETGEVIRQIPAEETLAIAKNLDTVQGMLIRSKA